MQFMLRADGQSMAFSLFVRPDHKPPGVQQA
jgi:hypothetical protein